MSCRSLLINGFDGGAATGVLDELNCLAGDGRWAEGVGGCHRHGESGEVAGETERHL